MDVDRPLTLRRNDISRPWLPLSGWTAVLLLGLLSMTAFVLVVRRLAGALEHPLGAATLVAAGASLAAIALAIRLGWQHASRRGTPSPADWGIAIGTSLALLALGAALDVAGTQPVGRIAFWSLLVLEEAWAWTSEFRRRAQLVISQRFRVWRQDSAERPSPHAMQTPPPLPASQLASAVEDVPPEHVDQQLVRSHAADSDVLSGFVRVGFLQGQRTGSVHVAFCPPFTKTPDLTVEQLDGPDARIKTAALLPYGVRLDLKLAAEADEPTSVLLQFEVREGLGD